MSVPDGPDSPTATFVEGKVDGVELADGTKAGQADAAVATLPVLVDGLSAEAQGSHRFDFGFIPIPRRLRYDPAKPVPFTMSLNLLFTLGTTFASLGMYLAQPVLLQMAEDLGTSYEKIANVPTLIQAGYAGGLLLITPLGDLVRRRQLIIGLFFISTCLSMGIAFGRSLIAVEVLSFIQGLFCCAGQIILPLCGDIAPEHKKSSAIAISVTGFLCGTLLGRLIGGTMGEFVAWRYLYWLNTGLLGLAVILFYSFLPDFPAKSLKMGYLRIMASVAKYAVTEPLLIQVSLEVALCGSAFGSFWVTLTFLLGGEPYNYNSLEIGLFGIAGLAGIISAPLLGYFLNSYQDWLASFLGIVIASISTAVYIAAAGSSVAAVVIQAFLIDVGFHGLVIGTTARVQSIDAAARARHNSIYVLATFVGLAMGTWGGSLIFLRYGYRAAGLFNLAAILATGAVLAARGPHEARHTWFGWKGGRGMRKPKREVPLDSIEKLE